MRRHGLTPEELENDPFYRHLRRGGTVEEWFALHPEEDVPDDDAPETRPEPYRSAAWTPEGWSYKKALDLGIFARRFDENGTCVGVAWVGEDHLREK